MRYRPQLKTTDNEDGFVLVATMLILILLVVIGISATNTTSIEYQIAVNDRMAKEDFYNQETCMADAKFRFRTWLDNNFITSAETAAYFPPAGNDANGNGINDNSECLDANGQVIGTFKVRDMESTGTPIATWEDVAEFPTPGDHPANDFPLMDHTDAPDPGSGYDPTNFEIRRFIITTYSPDSDKNVVLQEGVYKVFNRF